MRELFQFIDGFIQQIQIVSNTLYVLMSTKPNPQLEFFIKLTQIIGRAFTDIQQLLTSQLKRQQSDGQNQSVSMIPSPSQQPIQQISDNLVNLSSHLQVLAQNEKKQSQEQGENNKQQIVERSQRNVKKSIRIKKRPKLGNSKFVLKEKKKKKRKTSKIEGKPCPPLNAFMLFLNDNKYDIMDKKPELSPSEVTIYASTMWNGFDQSEKQTYLDTYKKNHGIYLQEMRKYKEQLGKKETKNTKKQESQEDKKIPEIQNIFKPDLKSKMKTRIKKRKFIRNQVISVESSQQNQLI